MHYPIFPRSIPRRVHAAGAALTVAALAAGCGDAAAPLVPSPNLETIAPPVAELEVAAATAGAPARTKGRIVFIRDGDVYIMNANGSGAAQLTTLNGIVSPVLSPSGAQIAFVRLANGMGDIYVMNTDATGLTRLTQNAGFNSSPTWSPSGGQIAFASTRDGDADIYVMNADGTGVTPLTVNSVYDGEPAWSPGGSRIAFVSERISASNREIYVMDADGNTQVRLTTSPLWDQRPAWSPDESRIAYACDRLVPQAPVMTVPEICVMNADGTGVMALTDAPTAFDSGPTWSLDGTRIAFESDRDGDYDLYAVKPSGGRVSILTRNTASDAYASWGR